MQYIGLPFSFPNKFLCAYSWEVVVVFFNAKATPFFSGSRKRRKNRDIQLVANLQVLPPNPIKEKSAAVICKTASKHTKK